MIYYTVQSNVSFETGQVIQKTNDSIVLNDGTGLTLGVVTSCNFNEDTNIYEVVIYAAGGGGSKIKLSSAWNGKASRFEFLNDGITPTSAEGHGWLIPDYPTKSHVSGELVSAAIYK